MENVKHLIDLFDSIGITEKGIEHVYDYLLTHRVIEDPKILQDKLHITSFQRVYKILKVLKDLDLVYTYGRPMKSVLNSPIKVWQKIISNKIKEIQQNATQEIKKCETSFDNMLEAYELGLEEPELPPVEFINIAEEEDPIDFVTKDLFGDCSTIRMSKDHFFNIPFLKHLSTNSNNASSLQISTSYIDLIESFQSNLTEIKFRILISNEYFLDLLPKFQILTKQFREIKDPRKKNLQSTTSILDIKIHEGAVGNFIVKDQRELLQYSINPSNFLIGMFVSRQQEIIDVFKNKFDEKFDEAQPLDEKCTELNLGTYSDYEKGLLFLI
jgi:hypothetical protein